ncbi:unnamed protein product [Brassica rapa]|uniref:Uncharacterized protein n=1 Tax=Brassica campestris TaxID=3711 RepID=A0A3P6CPQ8_BRACM|nr:unnamed protein product [Brassica rapa]VDD17656.1 unnamed protein product [Brassica rapa]
MSNNSPSSTTTSHDSIIPQNSPPCRLSKTISAQQVISLPSCFSGKKRAIFFSPHFTALDHLDWAVSVALLWIKRPQDLPGTIVIVEDIINHTRTLPLLRVQHLVHLPHAFLWFINKRMLIPKILHAKLILHHHTFHHASHDPISSA